MRPLGVAEVEEAHRPVDDEHVARVQVAVLEAGRQRRSQQGLHGVLDHSRPRPERVGLVCRRCARGPDGRMLEAWAVSSQDRRRRRRAVPRRRDRRLAVQALPRSVFYLIVGASSWAARLALRPGPARPVRRQPQPAPPRGHARHLAPAQPLQADGAGRHRHGDTGPALSVGRTASAMAPRASVPSRSRLQPARCTRRSTTSGAVRVHSTSEASATLTPSPKRRCPSTPWSRCPRPASFLVVLDERPTSPRRRPRPR